MSDYHPLATQSLINIRPPKPQLVIYIFFLNLVLFFSPKIPDALHSLFRFFHATLSFPENQNPLLPQNQNPKTQNSNAAGVIEEAMSKNPLLPQNQNPKTQNLDAVDVIEEAMSNLTQPLKQVLEFS